jgi:hypothetical protein
MKPGKMKHGKTHVATLRLLLVYHAVQFPKWKEKTGKEFHARACESLRFAIKEMENRD